MLIECVQINKPIMFADFIKGLLKHFYLYYAQN